MWRNANRFILWIPASIAGAYATVIGLLAASSEAGNPIAKVWLDSQFIMLRGMWHAEYLYYWVFGLVLLWFAAFLWIDYEASHTKDARSILSVWDNLAPTAKAAAVAEQNRVAARSQLVRVSPPARVPASQGIAYIVLRKWGKTLDDAATSLPGHQGLLKVLNEFEQGAHDGRISVWGKVQESGLSASPLETNVPAEHWQTHRLNYLPTHLLSAQTEARLSRHKGDPIYTELRVNRAEFESEWPRA